MKTLALSAWAVLLAVLLLPTAASAHATLQSSDPADGAVLQRAPSTVTLRFDEPVSVESNGAQVIAPDGDTVSTSVAGSGSELVIKLRSVTTRGTYAVTWRVLSADSHVVAGSISYSVGAPSKPPTVETGGSSTAVDVLFGIARGLGYLGFAILVGSAAFCCYATVRDSRMLWVWVLSWLMLVVGTFGVLLLQGAKIGGTGLSGVAHPDVLLDTLRTRFGIATTARLLLAGMTPAVLIVLLQRRLAQAAGAAIAVGMAATWSLSGHAATSSQRFATVPADTVHMLAAAAWLGGLVGVLLLSRDDAAAVRRFSAVAATSVIVLAATGIYQAWLRVGFPQSILTTSYGRLLLIKVAVVSAILMAACWVRLRLARKGNLRYIVRVEAIGVAAVVGVTAALVGNQPARDAYAAKPLTVAEDQVSLSLPDRRRGVSTATLEVESAREVEVRFVPDDQEMGVLNAKVSRTDRGHYRVRFAPLSAADRWTAVVTVRTSAIDSTTVELPIHLY